MEELLLIVVFVVWISIGFLTALVRWRWIEGPKRITSDGIASSLTMSANDHLILDDKEELPEGCLKRSREIGESGAKGSFFASSMFLGPIGTFIFLLRWSWSGFMRTIPD